MSLVRVARDSAFCDPEECTPWPLVLGENRVFDMCWTRRVSNMSVPKSRMLLGTTRDRPASGTAWAGPASRGAGVGGRGGGAYFSADEARLCVLRNKLYSSFHPVCCVCARCVSGRGEWQLECLFLTPHARCVRVSWRVDALCLCGALADRCCSWRMGPPLERCVRLRHADCRSRDAAGSAPFLPSGWLCAPRACARACVRVRGCCVRYRRGFARGGARVCCVRV